MRKTRTAEKVSDKVIGGLFGLDVPSRRPPGSNQCSPFEGSPIAYLLNGRSTLYVICQSLKPKTAWLPSYLCGALLDPFRKTGVTVRYYNAGPNFSNVTNYWVSSVQAGDLVVVIHYFGFPNQSLPAEELERQEAVIIEDASQGLFIKQQYEASFGVFYSARKFLGVPDGGLVASSRLDELQSQILKAPPRKWWSRALSATRMRRDFDQSGGENRWFPLYQMIEESSPVGAYRASDTAVSVIEATDYEQIKRTRRENYMVLEDRLRRFALFPILAKEIVPLGFPVCVDAERRDAVLHTLYKDKIFPPVHWRIEDVVPKEYGESHTLSRRILTLICDQRYTSSDMTRQANAFLSALN